MSKKIALIGCGIWGKKILRDLLSFNCKVSIFDTNRNLKLEIPNHKNVAFLQHLPHQKKYDGIIVATPSTTHRRVLESIVGLNLPIFVEKPLTTNYADALALEKIVHSEVYLMHVWLYHGGIQRLAAIAKSRELGKVLGVRSTRANWTSPRKDVDSVWNLAPHDLTIIQAILGEIPTPQAVMMERHQGIARGMLAILGKNPSAIFEVSNRYERKIREVRLHCEDGIAVLKDEKVGYLEVVKGNHTSKLSDIHREKRPFDTTPPLYQQLKAFIHYLEGGPPPLSHFRDGLFVVKTIHHLQTMANTYQI